MSEIQPPFSSEIIFTRLNRSFSDDNITLKSSRPAPKTLPRSASLHPLFSKRINTASLPQAQKESKPTSPLYPLRRTTSDLHVTLKKEVNPPQVQPIDYDKDDEVPARFANISPMESHTGIILAFLRLLNGVND